MTEETTEIFSENQNFLEKPAKFSSTFFQGYFNRDCMTPLSPMPEITLSGPENAQNYLTSEKIDFVKVQDIVTPIPPRKKKHQSNV